MTTAAVTRQATRQCPMLSVKDECVDDVARLPALLFQRQSLLKYLAHVGDADLLVVM